MSLTVLPFPFPSMGKQVWLVGTDMMIKTATPNDLNRHGENFIFSVQTYVVCYLKTWIWAYRPLSKYHMYRV